MGVGYSFLTAWLLESPREPVWDAIYEQERWPEWWRGVEAVEVLEPGGEDGVGKLARLTWRSRLPYDLCFDARTRTVLKPHLIEADAHGELTGEGRWRLFERDRVTAVLYEWNVTTQKRWMNTLAPLLRPAFEWNHSWVMANGGAGIASLLGCRLLASG
jgi:uncharacterized protein YndB with AHSA1/START domain